MVIIVKVITTAVILIVALGAMSNCLAQSGDSGGKQLSVERIYSQPSLSGRLLSGMTWMPDGASVSYLETKGYGKEARKELWSVSAANGEKKLLLSSEKLETVLPEDKSKHDAGDRPGPESAGRISLGAERGGNFVCGAKLVELVRLEKRASESFAVGQDGNCRREDFSGRKMGFVCAGTQFARHKYVGRERTRA